jgi:hypothetical protein
MSDHFVIYDDGEDHAILTVKNTAKIDIFTQITTFW